MRVAKPSSGTKTLYTQCSVPNQNQRYTQQGFVLQAAHEDSKLIVARVIMWVEVKRSKYCSIVIHKLSYRWRNSGSGSQRVIFGTPHTVVDQVTGDNRTVIAEATEGVGP